MSDEKQPDSRPELQPPDPGWKEVEKEINPAWRTATHVLAGDELMRAAPRFSILLCTVINRASLFALLHAEVLRQSEGRSVEVLVACDAKEISIGKKRQNLLTQATGDYCAFVDDDDWIAPTYVDDILTALESNSDCVGFKIECTTNGKNPESAITSMGYPRWAEHQDGFAHVRSIYHKSPHRREIGLKVGFPDLRYGEDRPYSAGLMRHVKTESFIDKVLYHYRFRSEPFAAKYGLNAGSRPPREPIIPTPPVPVKRDAKGRRIA
jgi:hypothetical protein